MESQLVQIKKIGSHTWEKAYNIFCKTALPLGDKELRTPFALTLCQIPPYHSTASHCHEDQEIFLIIKGSGVMQIEEEIQEVSTGDAIFIPPHSEHTLRNLSHSEPLEFHSIAWVLPYRVKKPTFTLIIPAPPTPNGPLHLGHLSGPYLSADVFARYLSIQNANVSVSIGTDDNQSYVPSQALQLNLTNEEVVKRYRPLIIQSLKAFGCSYDEWLSPFQNNDYTKFVQDIFKKLIDGGFLILRKAPTVFCESTQKFIYGSQISGTCPHCKTPTGGNGCENCGCYNDCIDLIDPKSNFGDGKISIKEVNRYYFPLSQSSSFLEETLKHIEMHPKLREFYLNYFKLGLPDVSASQFSNWGIPVPGQKNQIIYEWIEMAASLLYLSKRKGQKGVQFWKSHQNEVVQSFGFDNSFFYGLLLPALMHKIDTNIRPPKGFLSNYFYQLNEKKFSTSRNHAIWAHDILEFVPSDSLRFYLCLTRSEDEETNFQLSDFENFLKTELVDRWESFFNSLDHTLKRYRYEWAVMPKLKGYQEKFLFESTQQSWKIQEFYELRNFSLNGASDQLSYYLNFLRKFWFRNRHRHTKENLSLCLSALQEWAKLITPIMINFGKKLSTHLMCEETSAGVVETNKVTRHLCDLKISDFSISLEQFRKFLKK